MSYTIEAYEGDAKRGSLIGPGIMNPPRKKLDGISVMIELRA